jgi:mannitol/fructose-specific phosphotransferase system IIA component (Ntr-type)
LKSVKNCVLQSAFEEQKRKAQEKLYSKLLDPDFLEKLIAAEKKNSFIIYFNNILATQRVARDFLK